LDYISAPLGRGQPVPGPLLPLVALPTTAGTGSEVTTVAVVDLPAMHTKAGVSHRFLRPSLAIVDPLLTISCPPAVTAATGLDALFHALEAYTALRYDARPQLPLAQRPPYQGSNPFSDVLCEQAIGLIGRNLRTAVADGGDVPARSPTRSRRWPMVAGSLMAACISRSLTDSRSRPRRWPRIA
jgi:alcohol dehydrogenase class IV